MFEIWRHVRSGERYLVVVRDGMVNVAAGPLSERQDPREVLATHSNQQHNPRALLHMRRAPQEYVREYTSAADGSVVSAGDAPPPAP
jgi:hypothetical protein